MVTTKRPTKFFAMITYVVVLICLVVGFFYPYGTVQGTDGMIAMQLPAVIDILFGTTLNVGAAFSFPVVAIELFGIEALLIENVYALLIFAYAVITVLGVLALLPVCISNRYKSTAKIFANIIELLALLVLSLYVLNDLCYLSAMSSFYNWALYIVFGGVAIVYIVQNIASKGGSGVIKALLFILSAVSVYAMFYLYGLLEHIIDPMNSLATSLNAVTYFLQTPIQNLAGYEYGFLLFHGQFFGEMGIVSAMEGVGIGELTVLYCLLGTGLLISLNFFLDMFGIAKKTNKAMLICNLVRYSILLILLCIITITATLIEGKVGLMCYIVIIASVLALLINLIRFIKYIKGKKATNSLSVQTTEPAYDYYGDNLYEQLESDTTPIAAQPAPVVEQVAASAPVYQAPVAPVYQAPVAPATPVKSTEYQQVYNVSSIYNGPSDSFINKLTNEEKIEFAKVFLERRYGSLTVIPQYVFGGDNKKFFSSIFIYISRVREYLSNNLMNKIYEELNLLR